ncbi:hypothetical protein GEMRC1_012351 [Eukaryota sp. GEM-RC1]
MSTISEDDKVTLSTIHSSKGLGFSTVFLTGLVNGKFPLISTKFNHITVDLDEELRLFYVAVTRAKVSLICTVPLSADYCLSSFIDEMIFQNFKFVPPANSTEIINITKSIETHLLDPNNPSLLLKLRDLVQLKRSN